MGKRSRKSVEDAPRKEEAAAAAGGVDEQAQSGEDNTHFWASSIRAGEDLQFSMEGIELSLQSITLPPIVGDDKKNGTGPCQLMAQTAMTDEPICIGVVSSANPYMKLDCGFYAGDRQLTLQLIGDGEVHIAGGIHLDAEMMLALDSDEEEEEEDEEAEDEEAEEEEEEEEGEEEEEEEEEENEEEEKAPAQPQKRARSEPKLQLKAGPNGLKYHDFEEGKGKKPRKGKKVEVAYIGRLTNGNVFDRSNKFSFRLGVGEVIRGWDLGVGSMRVGGKRRLIVPSELAYGAAGAPPDIPPRATLIFDIVLKKAH